MFFGGFPIPGITCSSPPLVTKTWTPVGKGIPLPAPTTFGKPLATPVAAPVTVGGGRAAAHPDGACRLPRYVPLRRSRHRRGLPVPGSSGDQPVRQALHHRGPGGLGRADLLLRFTEGSPARMRGQVGSVRPAPVSCFQRTVRRAGTAIAGAPQRPGKPYRLANSTAISARGRA